MEANRKWKRVVEESKVVKEVFLKMCRFCAYQERAPQEVKEKLLKYSLGKLEVEQIIDKLIDEDFLNEKRFAELYARSKFNQKKWGKIKIQFELKKKGVSDHHIDFALEEIDEKVYLEVLSSLLAKKVESLKEENELQRKSKLIRFANSKGYSLDSIYQVLKSRNNLNK